jgi:hypothetical protein
LSAAGSGTGNTRRECDDPDSYEFLQLFSYLLGVRNSNDASDMCGVLGFVQHEVCDVGATHPGGATSAPRQVVVHDGVSFRQHSMFQPRRADNRPLETASVDEELHCRGVIGNVAENGLTEHVRKDSRIIKEHGDAQYQQASDTYRLHGLPCRSRAITHDRGSTEPGRPHGRYHRVVSSQRYAQGFCVQEIPLNHCQTLTRSEFLPIANERRYAVPAVQRLPKQFAARTARRAENEQLHYWSSPGAR